MKVTSLVKELKDPCTSENEHPKKNGQFELADETEKSWAMTPSLRGESHVDFRLQCVIMTQTRWPPTPCHMHPFQNFDRIDSFLNSVLNICILGNLIVGWGVRVIEERVGTLYQIYRFNGGVNIWGNRIHQSKSWYYLGHPQTSKVEFFAEIVFGKKLLTLQDVTFITNCDSTSIYLFI